MTILEIRKTLLSRLKKDGRKNYKALAAKIPITYSTLRSLFDKGNLGTVRSWAKIEKYFAKVDAANQAQGPYETTER